MTKHLRQISPTIGKAMMALAFASVLGGTPVAPAFAIDNDGRQNNG